MAEDIVATNTKVRELLRRSSPLMLKRVGEVTSSTLGNTVRVKLLNAGLITGLMVQVRATYDLATGTSAVYATSTRGVYALVPRIRLTDFDGSDRVIASSWQLNMLSAVRLQDENLTRVVASANNGTASARAFDNPTAQTTTGTGRVLTFWLYIPVAVNAKQGDLRGMLLAQTGVGELNLVFDIAGSMFNSTQSDDAVFYAVSGSGHAVTLQNVTITVYQEFYLPQQVEGVVPIPPLDTLTVYELNGGITTSDNIALNAEKLISLPNARSIHGVYYTYHSSGVFTDLAQHRLIANGNTVIREAVTVEAMEIMQRWILGYDFPNGCYFMDFSSSPIQTNLFGNIQLGLTPTSSPSSPKIEIMFESLYMKGAALSGLSQAG